jgi:membrane protein
MVAVPERIRRLEQQPSIAHLIRAIQRYLSRLGSQFAAATAYFSVLAVVPVLMMAFSVTGLVLTAVQPGLLDDVSEIVADVLGKAEPETRQQILELVDNALSSFWTIGIIGLLAAI